MSASEVVCGSEPECPKAGERGARAGVGGADSGQDTRIGQVGREKVLRVEIV